MTREQAIDEAVRVTARQHATVAILIAHVRHGAVVTADDLARVIGPPVQIIRAEFAA